MPFVYIFVLGAVNISIIVVVFIVLLNIYSDYYFVIHHVLYFYGFVQSLDVKYISSYNKVYYFYTPTHLQVEL